MRSTVIVLLCLILATDAVLRRDHILQKQLRSRTKKQSSQGTDCTNGKCFNKDAGDKCFDGFDNEVTSVEECNAPGSSGFGGDPVVVYCCPEGNVVRDSMEQGLGALSGMLDAIHVGHPAVRKSVADASKCIFTDGELIADTILNELSQYDLPTTATETEIAQVNQWRCGPTSSIAAAINKGSESFLKLLEFAKDATKCPAPQTDKVDAIKASFDSKETTMGQLGELEQILFDCFADENFAAGVGDRGLSGAQVVKLLEGAGIAKFNKEAKGDITRVKHESRFPKGESWGLLLEERGHWILVGQTKAAEPEKGKAFVFDPDSYEGLDQHLFYYDPAKTKTENQLFLDYFGSIASGWASGSA